MARTIGKKNIALVKRLVADCRKEDMVGAHNITEEVIGRLPMMFWDIWEGARAEVERIIWDEVLDS